MVNIDLKARRKEVDDAYAQLIKEGQTSEELIKKQNDNSKRIALARGEILNYFAYLEHLLNMFLANYFTANDHSKYFEMYDLIFAKEYFAFSKKIELLDKIGYHKKDEFGNKYDGLVGLLKKVNKKRNLVAHGFQTHFTEPEVRLLSKEDSFTKLDDKFLSDFRKDADLCFWCLSDLRDHIAGIDKFEVKAKKKGAEASEG